MKNKGILVVTYCLFQIIKAEQSIEFATHDKQQKKLILSNSPKYSIDTPTNDIMKKAKLSFEDDEFWTRELTKTYFDNRSKKNVPIASPTKTPSKSKYYRKKKIPAIKLKLINDKENINNHFVQESYSATAGNIFANILAPDRSKDSNAIPTTKQVYQLQSLQFLQLNIPQKFRLYSHRLVYPRKLQFIQ